MVIAIEGSQPLKSNRSAMLKWFSVTDIVLRSSLISGPRTIPDNNNKDLDSKRNHTLKTSDQKRKVMRFIWLVSLTHK